jgi:hypothetical protein
MKTKLHTLLVGASCALLPVSAFAELSFVSGVDVTRGGEIVAFDKANDLVLTTNSFNAAGLEDHAINIYSLSNTGSLNLTTTVNLNTSVFASVTDILSVSSVAVDPLGRDFGVASVIPTANNTTQGRIALFQLSTGTVLKTLDVGYHPDSVCFTPNGSRILVANEGEFVTTGPQSPGSVSIVDVSSVTGGATGISSLSGSNVTDVNFSTGLASGVTLTGLRNNRLDTLQVKTADALDVEPEYITSTNDKAYVTLQENNAIAVVDLTGVNAGKVTDIHLLGTINQRIDASDRDGAANSPATERPADLTYTSNFPAAKVDDVVAGMPMPDTAVTFQKNGVQVIATANEGDFRLDDADRVRLRDASRGTGGSAQITDTIAITSAMDNNAVLGRLRISNIDGDTDADGKIEVPTMPGTRSFTLWNAETGAIVFDSGSAIEDYVKANNLASFGIEGGTAGVGFFDSRSDDKGPEPEALAFGQVNGRDLIFVGAERENGIFQFDITDLNNVEITGYYNTVTGTADDGFGAFISPESIQFISASDSPTGQALIIVGYEGVYDSSESIDISGSLAAYSVTAIPEPSTAAALAGFGALGLAALRRRRSSR